MDKLSYVEQKRALALEAASRVMAPIATQLPVADLCSTTVAMAVHFHNYIVNGTVPK